VTAPSRHYSPPQPAYSKPSLERPFYPCPPNLMERLNLRLLYGSDGRLVKVYCPAHNDLHEPNLAVFPRNTHCFVCGFHEAALDHIKRVCNCTSVAEVFYIAEKLLRDAPKPTSPVVALKRPISPSLVVNYMDGLDGSSDMPAYVVRRYGLPVPVQKSAHLGYAWAVKALTIPVYELDGTLVNIRYRSTGEGASMKYWGTEGHNEVRWYYPPSILEGRGTLKERIASYYTVPLVLITEGEFDALALYTWGLPAISCTSGAQALGSYAEKVGGLLEQLRGLRVLVAYDQDEAGQAAAQKVATNVAQYADRVSMLNWPLKLGKDPSELLAAGYILDRFRSVCKATKFTSGGEQ
jgi:hypothetical protein